MERASAIPLRYPVILAGREAYRCLSERLTLMLICFDIGKLPMMKLMTHEVFLHPVTVVVYILYCNFMTE